jgi:NTE family protein
MRKPISLDDVSGIRDEHHIMTSSQSVNSVAKAVPSEHRLLPGQVVLVLQGGGAPGCYQAGVYQAMHEAGIEPDWVIGTSIGAINGAIIAGNKIGDRLDQLHKFWSSLEGWFAGPWGSLTTLLAGVPGFFAPNPAVAWGLETKVGIERAALYSIDPLKKLLPKLVDFDLINSGKPRFTVGLVNVRSGQMRYFDNREGAIGLDHVLGSSAIPPSFPAVRLDGEAYWDGGIYSNTPVEVVFDDNPRRSSVVFAVQIWHTQSAEPDSIAQVFMRQKDILFGSRSRSHIARHAQLHRMRQVVRELYKMLPEERRNTPEAKALAAYGCATFMHLLEINARPIDGESNMRDFDFSKAAINARWRAGYTDAQGMIARRPWENPVDPLVGVAVYTSDPDN